MFTPLREVILPQHAAITTESIDEDGGKSLYMEGIFIQGGVKNQNQRVYPVSEISNAVGTLSEKIKKRIHCFR